jgi:hypothetical protein
LRELRGSKEAAVAALAVPRVLAAHNTSFRSFKKKKKRISMGKPLSGERVSLAHEDGGDVAEMCARLGLNDEDSEDNGGLWTEDEDEGQGDYLSQQEMLSRRKNEKFVQFAPRHGSNCGRWTIRVAWALVVLTIVGGFATYAIWIAVAGWEAEPAARRIGWDEIAMRGCAFLALMIMLTCMAPARVVVTRRRILLFRRCFFRCPCSPGSSLSAETAWDEESGESPPSSAKCSAPCCCCHSCWLMRSYPLREITGAHHHHAPWYDKNYWGRAGVTRFQTPGRCCPCFEIDVWRPKTLAALVNRLVGNAGDGDDDEKVDSSVAEV